MMKSRALQIGRVSEQIHVTDYLLPTNLQQSLYTQTTNKLSLYGLCLQKTTNVQ